MEYSFVTAGNVKIAYIEKNPSGNPVIFFIHGNSFSSRMWTPQLEDAQLSSFRLVALDLPAHGNSDGLEGDHNNILHIAKLASDAVVQLAREQPYILVGFSFGANVVAEMLAHLRPRGLVFAGPSVIGAEKGYAAIGKEGGDTAILFMDDVPDEVLRHFSSAIGEPSLRQQFREDYRSVKAPFRSTILAQAGEGKISDEFALIRNCGVPALIVFGKEDTLVDPHYMDDLNIPVWKEIYRLPGAGHYVSIDAAEEFDGLLKEYVEANEIM